MKLTDLYLKPEEIRQASYIKPGNSDNSFESIAKASAKHAVKKVVEYLDWGMLDIKQDGKDYVIIHTAFWQTLKKLVQELDKKD